MPARWIERASETRKNKKELVAKVLKEDSLDALDVLREWELAYRKECFWPGIRALMDLQRTGKTEL